MIAGAFDRQLVKTQKHLQDSRFCNLDNPRRRFFTGYSHCSQLHRLLDVKRALRGASYTRQHFLKQDTVFLNVLVYSGCSAFRFPSARSD